MALHPPAPGPKEKPGSSHNSDHGPSQSKAKEILSDGTSHGRPLTKRQRRFMGARAGGAPVMRRAQ